MALQHYRLPDVGEGLTEATVMTWLVAEGDTVAVNDPVVEVETAKSVVELPCPYAGVVAALLVPAGKTVEVGTALISVEDGVAAESVPEEAAGASTDANPAAAAPGPETEAPPASQATLVGTGPRELKQTRLPRKTAENTLVVAPPRDPDVRTLAKPSVRKLARDLGVDIASVTPTGPDGTVSQDDVTAAATQQGGWTGFISERGETRIDVTGIRRATARAMVESAFTAPHVTEWTDVDVTRTMELLERMKTMRMFRDVRITPTVLIARAVCVALRRNPELNSSWDEKNSQIVRKSYINLGFAADTPRGLVVPVIHDADAMSTYDLATALNTLTQTARQGKATPADLSGGTFTITNIGVFGIDAGTPILTPGQAGILAVGQITKRPWVVEDRVEPRWVTTLALSFDHRMVDGAEGSAFLGDIAEILRDPGSTLIMT
ncbi:MAG TPA: dihydrolipoamide acetyltransferase family protein [Propionibacteriaceae bacterium]|nr:dihydrolipoamide acetyltransferase family protein [Propionibacteriaceae bacterium]